MRTIRARLVLLVASAAVAPLVAYGVVSMTLLRGGTEESAISQAQVIAEGAAGQIDRYLRHNLDLLEAVSADLQHTSLLPWQQERILRNYVLTFPDLSELTLFDATGEPVVSSRVAPPRLSLLTRPSSNVPMVAPLEIDEDMFPKTVVTLRVEQAGRTAGYLVGSLRLEELWRLVDRIRIGQSGYALLVDGSGRLIAHGNPDEKPKVARGQRLETHPLIQAGAAADQPWKKYRDDKGRRVLGVVQPVASMGWRVVIEQPTSEAFALAARLEWYLAFTIGLALLATVTMAWLWGRGFLRGIGKLMRGTRALAEGRLQERVTVTGRDELAQLGAAFNSMAERLVALQAEAVKQERQATFGRIAEGLVHDIQHPIQNIGNNCKLILKMYDDSEYRETFRRMVDREFSAIRRLLEDLRNLGRPIPLERFSVDVNRSLVEAAEKMALLAQKGGITLEIGLSDDPLFIQGDLFALGRVYRNLLLNAMQATAPGGRILMSGRYENGRALVEVRDTGCGIPPERLGQIFDDYITTKRRGLGLGLAISRKIVEQLGGTIRVESEVGRGSAFTLDFPASEAPAQVHQPAEASA